MTDLAALDRAVEKLWNCYDHSEPRARHTHRQMLEKAITARAVVQEQARHVAEQEAAGRLLGQEQARRAKLVAALEHIERRADQWRECQDVATAALAADREQSHREGR